MIKYVLPILGIFAWTLSLPAAEAEASKPATSKITHVTVYPNSALVTREVDTPAGVGTFELVVAPLPPATVDSSLYSEGAKGIRVLATRYRSLPIKEDTREEVRKLQAEIKVLQEEIQTVQSDISAIQQNMQMIAKLEEFTSATTKMATDKATLDSSTAINLAKFVMETRTQKAKELVQKQQDMQTKRDQLSFKERQIRSLASGISRVDRSAVVVVDKTQAGAGKVRLNYLVNAASWRPSYKLRAGKEEKDGVQLEYLSAILQQTGEDWTGVSLTLSTAEPALNAAPPDLTMLAVAVVPLGSAGDPMVTKRQAKDISDQARNYRAMAQMEGNRDKQQAAAKLWNDAAALDACQDLIFNDDMKRRGKFANEGVSVTYKVSTTLSIPSRNDEQVVEVAKIDLKPDYYYKAVPVLTSHVYRQANLTNKSEYVLLPGNATMYQGSDFVGRLTMPLVAIGEQFTVGFGVDPQLQVQRELVDKSRVPQGGNMIYKYDYRILVSSYKAKAVKLQVWDRLPHAETESVGINVVKVSPELSGDPLYVRESKPKNLLRWDLTVEPTMNGEKAKAVTYQFQMALDRQKTISGFAAK